MKSDYNILALKPSNLPELCAIALEMFFCVQFSFLLFLLQKQQLTESNQTHSSLPSLFPQWCVGLLKIVFSEN